MNTFRRAFLHSIVVLIGAVPSAALATDDYYSVQPLRSDVVFSERVGPKRTGALCLPFGSVTWSEAAPDPAETAVAVASFLRAKNIVAYSASEAGERFSPDMPVQRLSATVMAAHIEACVPQHGLFRLAGGRKHLKASGWIKLRWRVTRAGVPSPVWEVESTEELSKDFKTEALPDLLKNAIGNNAIKVLAESQQRPAP